MKLQALYDGKTIEVEVDLAAHQLVPASRITEESAKRAAKEKEAADALKELAALKASSDLAATRLALAGELVPTERDAKRAMALYRSDTEGMEKPPTFAEWSAKDGASIVSVLRPAAPAPAPAGSSPAPVPAPAPAGAAPAPTPAPAPATPNTNTGALATQPAPPSKDALVRQYDELNQRYARAPHAERAALLKEIGEVEAKIRAPIGAAT